MNTIEQIVKNEPLDDIVTVFSLFKPNPHLDMMIRQYNRDLISQYGALEVPTLDSLRLEYWHTEIKA